MATTIDKYAYITLRPLPPFFEHTSRIVYSKIELVRNHSEIQHPAVRAVLDYMKVHQGVEVHYDGDLPARTGLGSSSSFTVAMLQALYAFKGEMPSKELLARDAIHVEQDVIGESVGCQDQVSAAYGGLNRIDFWGERSFHVTPVILPQDRLEALERHLLLIYTGTSRLASEIAAKQIEEMPKRKMELRAMYEMVDEAIRILCSGSDLKEFGDLMHEQWLLKRNLSAAVSTPDVDRLYEAARRAGAWGGKILGAGGGGFFLLVAAPDAHAAIRRDLARDLFVPVQFENHGSQIVFYERDHLPSNPR